MTCTLRLIRFVLLAASMLSLSPGCQSFEPKEAPETLTIQRLQEKITDFAGQTVTISGRFMGWRGYCKTLPPVTCSDWALEDQTGCIYVTGRLPEKGLNPALPKGEAVTVTGIVRKGPMGEAFLEIPR